MLARTKSEMDTTAVGGFEPPTYGFRGRCSTRLSYTNLVVPQLGFSGVDARSSLAETEAADSVED